MLTRGDDDDDDRDSRRPAAAAAADDVRDDDVAAVTCAVFADYVTNDAPTDDTVTSLESKHQMSLQSIKQLLLSSVSSTTI